jgi:glutamyl-tRNA synthetase
VGAAHEALSALESGETAAIEEALRSALIEGLGLKPRNAFGAVRVAVTGHRISPPLFESLELLGRESSLRRLEDAGRA